MVVLAVKVRLEDLLNGGIQQIRITNSTDPDNQNRPYLATLASLLVLGSTVAGEKKKLYEEIYGFGNSTISRIQFRVADNPPQNYSYLYEIEVDRNDKMRMQDNDYMSILISTGARALSTPIILGRGKGVNGFIQKVENSMRNVWNDLEKEIVIDTSNVVYWLSKEDASIQWTREDLLAFKKAFHPSVLRHLVILASVLFIGNGEYSSTIKKELLKKYCEIFGWKKTQRRFSSYSDQDIQKLYERYSLIRSIVHDKILEIFGEDNATTGNYSYFYTVSPAPSENNMLNLLNQNNNQLYEILLKGLMYAAAYYIARKALIEKDTRRALKALAGLTAFAYCRGIIKGVLEFLSIYERVKKALNTEDFIEKIQQ